VSYSKQLDQRPPQTVITHIICKVVTIEQDFLTNIKPVRIVGMSCEEMAVLYIQFVPDRLLKESRHPTVRTFIDHSNMDYQI